MYYTFAGLCWAVVDDNNIHLYVTMRIIKPITEIRLEDEIILLNLINLIFNIHN